MKKCPSSIQCWDSNQQPSEQESPPITIRPGLPPVRSLFAEFPSSKYLNSFFLHFWIRETAVIVQPFPSY